MTEKADQRFAPPPLRSCGRRKKGYEFQYGDMRDVTLAELAGVGVGGGKVDCPFFDFHIDWNARGGFALLRLTGEGKGIKALISVGFRWRGKCLAESEKGKHSKELRCGNECALERVRVAYSSKRRAASQLR